MCKCYEFKPNTELLKTCVNVTNLNQTLNYKDMCKCYEFKPNTEL